MEERERVCVCVCVCACACVHLCAHTHMFSKGYDVPMGRDNAFQGRVTYKGVILGSSVFTGAEPCDARRMTVEGGGIKIGKFG